jgi:hypothetical protein
LREGFEGGESILVGHEDGVVNSREEVARLEACLLGREGGREGRG